jgi:N-acyl-D-amino-acid deacylase
LVGFPDSWLATQHFEGVIDVYDLLIVGGVLFDGAGNPGIAGDVGIENDRIAALGPSIGSAARKTVNAEGLVVAPGFIDIKTHSDFTLPINPKAESKVRQGVTTEIIGHCGFSVAPALPGKAELLKDYLSPSAPWLPFRETSFPDYLESFPATAVNAGMLVGHNTLRLMVMGMADRKPSSTELEQMIALLEDGLRAGALGMSSGLFTPPGSFAAPAEMIAFGHVLKRHGAGYFTHLRDESNRVIEAVEEAIEVAEQCGIHVEIVHFKCSGTDNWGKAATVLDTIAQAKARGLDIDCDSYPYAAGSNPLKNLLPQWVQADGVAAMIERLSQREIRNRVRADIIDHGLNNWGRIPSWDCVQISISPHLPQHAGRTISALASERNADPIDTLCDFLAEDQGATRVLVTSISEDDIRNIVACPQVLVGSDGNCVAPYGIVGQGMPHPRFYGTFPRILNHFVRQEHLLPLEAAIHKMTGATARALKLHDRGLLKEGFCADIAIFDPDNFVDRATYAQPHQFPTGARTTVIINGTTVVDNAKHTGALPGRVLRRDGSGVVR